MKVIVEAKGPVGGRLVAVCGQAADQPRLGPGADSRARQATFPISPRIHVLLTELLSGIWSAMSYRLSRALVRAGTSR